MFAGLFPLDSEDYEKFRDALRKLALNDSSLMFEPEVSGALGFGMRCGFLGLLHMEIIQERLEREFNLSLISTAPTVVYEVETLDGETIKVENPANLPEPNKIRGDPRADHPREHPRAAGAPRRRDPAVHREARRAEAHACMRGGRCRSNSSCRSPRSCSTSSTA